MARKNLGPLNGLYPSLTTIVGVDVHGRANWLTVAHVGILNHATAKDPQYLSIGLNKNHHSTRGIASHGEFSINIPSRAMLELTDYCGLVSGKTTDKSELFPIQRGVLAHAPMIEDCPLSMACRLHQTLSLGQHEIFIGQVVETLVDEAVLQQGKPDLAKIDPLLFDFMAIDYWSLGQRVGKPWQAGKALKKGG
jgi:flavin reductase (DIM6/NTAB) family NADH-FMN oxidoreductase RutF